MKLKIFILTLLIPFILRGQFEDSFSDNDFVNNPEWTGNTDKFEVLDGELHLNDESGEGPAFLSTIVPTQGQTDWEFFVRLDFDPSTTNFAKVFIKSNVSDLSGDVNGYYVKIGGESGDLDDVSLYKQNGTSSTLIIEGMDGLASSFPELGVKVSRDDAGNWELLVDAAGGTNYVSQGMGFDDEFDNSSSIGVLCTYSATRSDKFYFDNFTVDPVFMDNEAPEMTSVQVVLLNQIQINFSEALDPSTALIVGNYSLNGDTPVNVSFVDGSSTSLLLTFGSNFVSGNDYTITANGIADLFGNIAPSEALQFAIQNLGANSVVINEIFADPTPPVGLPDSEFIELYNTTDEAIDLSGWTISDSGKDNVIPFGSNLAAGDFVILCNIDDVALWEPFGNVIGIASFISLTNGGELVWLSNSFGQQINAVEYSDGWYGDTDKSGGGWTLELIDPFFACQGSNTWTASNNPSGGTPGAANSVNEIIPDVEAPFVTSVFPDESNLIVVEFNELVLEEFAVVTSNFSIDNGIAISSIIYEENVLLLFLNSNLEGGTQYSLSVEGQADCFGNEMVAGTFLFGLPQQANLGDVLINEIYARPIEDASLPTFEFIELHNRTSEFLDLSEWTIEDPTGSRTFQTTILGPNEYLILCDPDAVSAYQSFGSTIGISGLISLNNDGDQLILRNADGLIMDEVNYTKDWYGSEIKEAGGWTLELLDPDYACQGMANWSASIDQLGGTPGQVNSQVGVPLDEMPPDLVRVEAIGNITAQLIFSEQLNPDFALNPANFNFTPALTIDQVQMVGSNVIEIRFNELLEIGQLYLVEVNGIEDCAGNLIGLFDSFNFGLPELAETGDVVINEFLYDPPSGGVRYVELFNRSNKVVDLSEYYIGNPAAGGSVDTLDSPERISETPYSIYPGDYVVLTPGVEWVINHFGDCENLNKSSFIEVDLPSFRSIQDVIGIIRNEVQGDYLDRVIYDFNWHHPLLDVTDGVALERIDPDGSSLDGDNWQSASTENCSGTPSYLNSQFYMTPTNLQAGITIEPTVFSPDDDGFEDFMKIYYNFETGGNILNATVYDDNGRKVRRLLTSELAGQSGDVKWDGSDDSGEKAVVGIYIIYFEIFDVNGNVESFKETCVIGGQF